LTVVICSVTHSRTVSTSFFRRIKLSFSNKRLAAQHGRFTLHGMNVESLHTQLTDCKKDRVLSAFILKTEGRLSKFKDQLYKLSVNEETIYQDLDSMIREIIRQETSHQEDS
jgi:hypothetical protein